MANKIGELPDELLINITNDLDYLEAVRLSSVTKLFFKVVDPQRWKEADKKAGVDRAEIFESNNRIYYADRFDSDRVKKLKVITDGFSCYGCFRVLDKSKFSRNQTEGLPSKGGYFHRNRRERRCIDCRLANGDYKSGTVMHSVTETVYSVRRGRMSLLSQVVIQLVVCAHCNKACEFISVGLPQVCLGCEKVQAQIDDSEEGEAMMKTRKYGFEIFECLACHGQNSVKIAEMDLRCEGCDEYICKKCFASKTEDCECERFEGPPPALGAVRYLFDTAEPKETIGCFFDEVEEAEVLKMFDDVAE